MPPPSIAATKSARVANGKSPGAPEAEPRGIGEVLHRRGAGRGNIEDARVGERVLQAQPGLALLRGLLLAALALVAGGVGHGVRLVEDDDAVEAAAEPVDDLLNPARLLALRLGAQGRVGGEEDAFVERDRGALAEARQRHDVGAIAADRGPVALGVLDQLVGLRDPHRPAAALQPVVEDDRGDLAALAGAGAVAEKPAAPEAHGVVGILRSGRDDIVGLVDGVGAGEMAGMGFAGIDGAFELRVRQDAGGEKAWRQMRPVGGGRRCDRGHRGRLNELRRMRLGAGDMDRLQRIAFIEACRQADAFGRLPVACLVGELDEIRGRRRPLDEVELRRGRFPPRGSHAPQAWRRERAGGSHR